MTCAPPPATGKPRSKGKPNGSPPPRPAPRNDTLNAAAWRLAHKAGNGLTDDDIRATLHAAAQRNGSTRDDGDPATLRTIDSGLAAGRGHTAS